MKFQFVPLMPETSADGSHIGYDRRILLYTVPSPFKKTVPLLFLEYLVSVNRF